LQPFSVRYEAKYDVEVLQPIIECEGHLPDGMSDDTAREMAWIELESLLTEARVPYMIERAKEIKKENPDEKIIVYTDYKSAGIVDQLQVAFRDAGFRVGLFTGDDKSGWVNDVGTDADGNKILENPFKQGKLDVLIATRTFQVGVDGAQEVCNTIFFNGFVWNDTDFEQIKGRLVRTGQTKDKVHVYLFFTTLEGFRFDYEVKYLRVLRKRALGDLIKDGRLPKDVSLGVEEQKVIAIDEILSNRRSGFPSKEKLQELHARRAEDQIKTELEELKKEYPNANFELGDDD